MLARVDRRLTCQDESSTSEYRTGLMMDAGRKRRILSEALERRSDQRHNAALTAAWAGLAACGSSLATYFDLASWTYLVPASIMMALVSGSAALCLLILDGREARDALTADTARCGLIIKQIQVLAQYDPKAPAVEALLNRLLGEVDSIAERHKGLDGRDLIAERRDPRFTVGNRTVTCTLRGGEQRSATIQDLSRSGVALKTTMSLAPGTLVTIGSTPARAVRMTQDGIAFEFLKPFAREKFTPDIVL